MSESFDFDEVDILTTGTVGPKGQRVFYVQTVAGGQTVSLRLEKQQVAALAEYLNRILEDLPPLGSIPEPSNLTFLEPPFEDWVAASMGVAYDERAERLLIFLEELVEEDVEEPATARFKLRASQVADFVHHARAIVAAGRPPCQYCARPLDPASDGWCPCSN